MAIQKPKKEKYVTTEVFEDRFGRLEGRFDSAMASIAQSFQSMEERMNERFERIENFLATHIQQTQEEHREFQKIIADHAIHISRHEQGIDNLTERVETIEKGN